MERCFGSLLAILVFALLLWLVAKAVARRVRKTTRRKVTAVKRARRKQKRRKPRTWGQRLVNVLFLIRRLVRALNERP